MVTFLSAGFSDRLQPKLAMQPAPATNGVKVAGFSYFHLHFR